jgi:ribonuclease-3
MSTLPTVMPAPALPWTQCTAPTPSRRALLLIVGRRHRSSRCRGLVRTDLRSLQHRLRLKFRDPALLEQALVHRSYLNEAPQPGTLSNERLEFLGDAVLGLVVARWLFVRYPLLPEGRLTELRSHLVKSETLAKIAARLHLGDYLLLGRGEESTGGRTRTLNQARALEAVIGAVFLDRGFRTTETWLLRTMDEDLSALGGGEMPEDAKSSLQHTAQMLFGSTPRYRILQTEGPEHDKRFTVEVVIGERPFGVGHGRSKRVAERDAAEAALVAIEAEHRTAAGGGTPAPKT